MLLLQRKIIILYTSFDMVKELSMFNLLKVICAVVESGISKYYAVEWILRVYKLKVVGTEDGSELTFQATRVDYK